MRPGDPDVIRKKIEECWHDGQSIKSTRISVKHCYGVKLGFDEVRRAFVRLSHQFTSLDRSAK